MHAGGTMNPTEHAPVPPAQRSFTPHSIPWEKPRIGHLITFNVYCAPDTVNALALCIA